MRWVGLFDGYVSTDGRFLVTQVTATGRRGPVTKWALYGLVRLVDNDPLAAPWRWSDRPIYGPVSTKRECQVHAQTMDYTPPELEIVVIDSPAPLLTIKRIGYAICQECGVDFPQTANWPYADYCGDNCFSIAEERVQEIRTNLQRRRA